MSGPKAESVASTMAAGAVMSERFARTEMAADELGSAVMSEATLAALDSDEGDVYVMTTSMRSQSVE